MEYEVEQLDVFVAWFDNLTDMRVKDHIKADIETAGKLEKEIT